MIRRREFIAGLGAAAWTVAARAQQAERVRRIGVLVNGMEDDSEMQARLAAFRQGLGQFGWSEGRNVRIDYRFSGGSPERFPQFAKELIALNPDIIFASSTPAVAALHRETRTIPIVFVGVSDPIGSGVVASLARPGGNTTGLLLYEDGIIGKWLGMLKEISPGKGRYRSQPQVDSLRLLPALSQSCWAFARNRGRARSCREYRRYGTQHRIVRPSVEWRLGRGAGCHID